MQGNVWHLRVTATILASEAQLRALNIVRSQTQCRNGEPAEASDRQCGSNSNGHRSRLMESQLIVGWESAIDHPCHTNFGIRLAGAPPPKAWIFPTRRQPWRSTSSALFLSP